MDCTSLTSDNISRPGKLVSLEEELAIKICKIEVIIWAVFSADHLSFQELIFLPALTSSPAQEKPRLNFCRILSSPTPLAP